MNRLIVWRHGETTWNVDLRVQGHADVELSPAGLAQAKTAAERLAELRPVRIVSSDLQRATQTAQALADLTGLPVRSDARLRERYYGPWQGRDRSEIADRWPAEYARWRAGESDLGLGIESLTELATRTSQALAEALFSAVPPAVRGPDAPADATAGTPQDAASVVPRGAVVVVVTHGGAARLGCGSLLGWPESATRTLRVLGNCRWTELHNTAAGGWALWSHNA